VEPRLVGAAEIAHMLGGLSRQRVSQLTAAEGFPEPVERLRMGSIWRYAEVAAWAERHGRTVHPIVRE
jgi:predicted DNA-binding transcriptional regulator AlpA